MTISIWRYSHLTLAISSFVFILLAALTGAILAVEPVKNTLEVPQFDLHEYSLATTLTALNERHQAVSQVKIDDYHRVQAHLVTRDGKAIKAFVHPGNGHIIGRPQKREKLFKFAQTLHRSLFLKSTGRLLMGISALLLFLIGITGIVLVAKRQGGYAKYFQTIVKESVNQYYHVAIGRWAFPLLILVSASGVFLSLDTLKWLPKTKAQRQSYTLQTNLPTQQTTSFAIFTTTKLADLKRLDFPFSEDQEDTFELNLRSKSLSIHQYTGQILQETNVTDLQTYYELAYWLHTGKGTFYWSFLLFAVCMALLFFIYSGFVITFSKPVRSKLPKNSQLATAAEYVILSGSESGATTQFASALHHALQAANKSVFSTTLNQYTQYPKAKYLLILSATYGDGEAPSNARNFLERFQNTSNPQQLQYAIIGFGSKAYPKFCQFADDIAATLANRANFKELLPLHKINQQSVDAFNHWVRDFNRVTGLAIKVVPPKRTIPKLSSFRVVHKTGLTEAGTFMLHLQPLKKTAFQSGDLLGIFPEADGIERLYSIGKINDKLVLSIKKHELGVCSTLLSRLSQGALVQGRIKANPNFQLSKKSNNVLFIANGTGIAPFLGMVQSGTASKNFSLYWGGTTKAASQLFAPILEQAEQQQKLRACHLVYSRENSEKQYVQDALRRNKHELRTQLLDGAEIYICGSLAMLQAVRELLDSEILKDTSLNTAKLLQQKRLKTDCY